MQTPAAPRFEPIVHVDEAVLRQRIIERIQRGPPASARLTLLTAPAGFGKTTVLAQLAAQTRAAGTEVAWLNCDERDKDPTLFCENLLAALGRCKLERTVWPLGTAPLATQLAHVRDEVLVCIDEYDSASSAAVDELVEQIALAAPPGLSVVLASRVAPNRSFTRLQLAGKVRLIDAELLRFTRDEAMLLLRDALTENAAAQVATYADGWPFALQLARLRATGLQDLSAPEWDMDPRAKIPRRQIFDYLAEEVIATIPAPVVEFLGEVAVLEMVDVAAANALRERVDSLGLIRQLVLLKPIVVVDDSLQRARLHPLLREYLCDSIALADPERIARLHLRAARHLAAQAQLHAAVGHALAGGRLDVAADIIEQAGAVRLVANEGALRSRLLLQQLPDAVVQKRPRLRLLQLACEVVEQNPAGTMPGFERVEQQVRDMEGPGAAAALLDLELVRCLMLMNQGEHNLRFPPWSVLAQTTRVAHAHAGEDQRMLGFVLPLEIFFLHRYGPVERCERRTREMEGLHADGAYTYNSPWIWMYRARNALARGDLDLAERSIRQSLHNDANYINYRQGSLGQLVTVQLGRIAYQRGEVETALGHYNSLHAEPTVTMQEILSGIHVEAAACEFALGNGARALEMLEAARQFADDEDLVHVAMLAGARQVEFAARSGDAALAASLATGLKLAELWQMAQEPFALPWATVEALAHASFLVHVQQGDAAGALAVAEALRTLAQGSNHRLPEVASHLMAARALALLGQDKAAFAEIALAVAFGAQFGAVQLFLDGGAELMALVRGWSAGQVLPEAQRRWTQQLLASWEALFRTHTQRAVVGTLTPREIDVLCEVAHERSTKLVARKLMLSPETVKHHLKGVFSKLEVKTRDEAVAEARRRALIP